MAKLYIVGLPKGISTRLTTAAADNKLTIECLLADVNRAGKLELVPFDGDAIYELNAYIDSLDDLSKGNLLVLPYAPISRKMQDTIDTISDCGSTVEEVMAKEDGWPWLDGKPDSGFLNALFSRLQQKFFPKRALTPSEHFVALAKINNKLLITTDSLTLCDKIAPHRKKFFIQSANAFIEYLDANGEVGILDEFFKKREIEHAQSGGINTTLQIQLDEKVKYKETRNTHLKQGEKTTPQACPRIYYHALCLEKVHYVGILYAGPHPSTDVSRIYHLG